MSLTDVLQKVVDEEIKDFTIRSIFDGANPVTIILHFKSGRDLIIDSKVITNSGPDGCQYLPSFRVKVR